MIGFAQADHGGLVVSNTEALNQGVARFGGDAAVVVSIARHSHVSFLAPLLAPAAMQPPFIHVIDWDYLVSIPVLHNPVVFALVSAVTND